MFVKFRDETHVMTDVDEDDHDNDNGDDENGDGRDDAVFPVSGKLLRNEFMSIGSNS